MLLIIIFFIENYSEKQKKSIILFHQNANNTISIDGYYIPKDRLLNPIYKKCSVDNCKKCYGNSDNNTCIQCFNSYGPIRDGNNKIISCDYNPKIKDDNNFTLNESNNSYFSDFSDENQIETIREINSEKTEEINSDLDTKNIEENAFEIITKSNTEETTENISTIISEIKIETTSNDFPGNKTEVLTKEFTDMIPQTTSAIQITTSKIMINCKNGYYLPEGTNRENECKKCSEKGCRICHGNNTINFCDSCYSNYIPRYINNSLTCFEPDKNCLEYDNIIFNCLKCRNEYVLYNNKCNSYSIEANYFTTEDDQNINKFIKYFNLY